jgi:hypothetical protein
MNTKAVINFADEKYPNPKFEIGDLVKYMHSDKIVLVVKGEHREDYFPGVVLNTSVNQTDITGDIGYSSDGWVKSLFRTFRGSVTLETLEK